MQNYIKIALFAAFATILSIIQLKILPQGGSIELLSFFLILMVLYLNLRQALLILVISQIITFLFGFATVLSPVQWFLDYILANAILLIPFGFIKNINLSLILGFFLKYIIHVISGYIFFSAYATGNILTYTLLYNLTYLLPTFIVTIIALNIIHQKYPFLNKK